MTEPKIITYTNLLHKCGSPDAKDVRRFLDQNADDAAFVRRAKMLNRLFNLKTAEVETPGEQRAEVETPGEQRHAG